MSWEKDPLWAKSKLYFQYAFEFPREDARFGLWCAMGLELLARAAVASVSPTLLAEPDREQKNLLHALNRGSERTPRKSLATAQVLTLCQTLFVEFTTDDLKSSLALINRRNDELHTGAAAFAEYTTQQWIAGFYRSCRSLCNAFNESLESLFGEAEANVAEQVLTETENEVKQRVTSSIAAHKKVFDAFGVEEKEAASKKASETADKLAYQRHHRVTCPACECKATVQGTPFGPENVSTDDDEIVVRQAVVPHTFSCVACNLKLNGYPELNAAHLGDQYTRNSTYAPDEYYGLIDPENADAVQQLVEEHLENLVEYDNE